MDEQDAELERLRIENRRLDNRHRMLIATLLLCIISRVEAGETEVSLEMLRSLHEHYRKMADW